jgi:hypothetical protein
MCWVTGVTAGAGTEYTKRAEDGVGHHFTTVIQGNGMGGIYGNENMIHTTLDTVHSVVAIAKPTAYLELTSS